MSLSNKIFYLLKRTTELKIGEGKYITLQVCGYVNLGGGTKKWVG
jgi:hypothetical protein